MTGTWTYDPDTNTWRNPEMTTALKAEAVRGAKRGAPAGEGLGDITTQSAPIPGGTDAMNEHLGTFNPDDPIQATLIRLYRDYYQRGVRLTAPELRVQMADKFGRAMAVAWIDAEP